MSRNHSEEKPEEKSGEKAAGKKQNLFFRVGETAEKIWKNKWYQWFFTILLIVALSAGAFAYRYIELETSIDSVIEDYLQSFSIGDWEEMYEASGAGEAGILYSIWETAMSAGRTNTIDSYTYKLTGTEDGIQYYTVTYQEKNSDGEKTLTIALQETGEVAYHFFKLYEVTAAPLVISDGTVTVPEGITFTFDTISSEEMDKTEGESGCTYSLPALLAGEYEVYLSGDTVEDQSCTVTVTENARCFTWLDYEMKDEIAKEMEDHLSEVVLTVLSEAVEYGEMERDYGSTIAETCGHDGLGDWNVLGTAINDSLKLQIPEQTSSEDAGTEDGDDEEIGDSDDTEYLEVTQLTIDVSEVSCYDFVYPDRCKVKLILDCGYTAGSSEIDILDPDAEEGQTRTGTIHMEFTATYLVDPTDWEILDCTYASSYTMDEPAAEEEPADEEAE